ncbi:tectonic-1-like [Varroa destructor]|uniref:Tectonic domain-containing protein n=1 Tax=Varroa destructor TaxID=109461 RepID=A0A7M7IY67_VARDE|nr:tectonic-1-like [Varroa destructor]
MMLSGTLGTALASGSLAFLTIGLSMSSRSLGTLAQTTTAPQTSTSYSSQNGQTSGSSFKISTVPFRACVKSLLCYCDLSNLCDLGCCCDPECEQTVTNAFSTDCPCDLPNEYAVPYCSQNDILISNQTHLIKRPIGDLFCIVDEHVYKKDTYTEGKTLAEEEFNRRLKHLEALGEYVAGSDEDHVLSFSRDGGIRQGNRMKVRLRSGQVTNFVIPSAIGGDTCDTLSLVRYLRPRRTRCLISFSCDSRFTQMSYFTDPAFLVTEALSSTVIPLAYICLFNKECAPHSTQDLTVCSYFSRVEYRIVHNGTLGVQDVYIFVYRNEQLPAHGTVVPLQIDVYFETKQDAAVRLNGGPTLRSGNPGYIPGKPILTKNGDSSTRPMSAPFRDCTDIEGGAVLFGENLNTVCLFSTCEEVRDNLPTMLAGDGYVGAYGSSDPRINDDWVVIDEDPLTPGGAQNNSCSFRINVLIAYQRTQFRISPQNRVVYVRAQYSALEDLRALVEINVDFVDMSDDSQVKYAGPPVIDVKLPEDFFYPLTFGASSARSTSIFGRPFWLGRKADTTTLPLLPSILYFFILTLLVLITSRSIIT